MIRTETMSSPTLFAIPAYRHGAGNQHQSQQQEQQRHHEQQQQQEQQHHMHAGTKRHRAGDVMLFLPSSPPSSPTTVPAMMATTSSSVPVTASLPSTKKQRIDAPSSIGLMRTSINYNNNHDRTGTTNPRTEQEQQKKRVTFLPIVTEFTSTACTEEEEESTWLNKTDLMRSKQDIVRTVQIFAKHNEDVEFMDEEMVCLRGLEGHLTSLDSKESKLRRVRHRHCVLQAQQQLFAKFQPQQQQHKIANLLSQVSQKSSHAARQIATERGSLDAMEGSHNILL
eukprot:CAMPEP_0119551034 /NCGR_PEP_ID=MMETSP1352-20130426/4426_1 /TAXON_ID=265584 /ORGANISM="Stauroneis constricta, Strain CCMP1120" /LENGTH=281 /DNA_ID=CAMNT_0007597041 /DNA_START=186 /DNA_END=1031 /DNA_ORIENTATION=-